MTTTDSAVSASADSTASAGSHGCPDESDPAGHGDRVVLTLDPATLGELRHAAGRQDLASYLCVLAGRHARWSELRGWLSQLEAAYGPLPPEALERVHRHMLGLPKHSRAGSPSLSVVFSAEEFAALATSAGDRPLAPFVRDLVIDHLTASGSTDSGPGGAGPGC
ncbi:hypothetical protein ACFOVU_25420 [Nocardiopsis sediminis]|uniref:Uncharacterized protein n=1 Tax=Nocardiopsis sediminis TaxID=1778267 RepID=A0ABV8FVE4_9ACTN